MRTPIPQARAVTWTPSVFVVMIAGAVILVAFAVVAGLRDRHRKSTAAAIDINAQIRTGVDGIQITNADAFAYEDVKVVINPMRGTYRASYGRIEPGESRSLPFSEFAAEWDNTRFDIFKTKVDHVMLNCRARGQPVSEEYRFKK